MVLVDKSTEGAAHVNVSLNAFVTERIVLFDVYIVVKETTTIAKTKQITEGIVLFDVYIVVKETTTIAKTNRNWSNVVCTLIDNVIRHH